MPRYVQTNAQRIAQRATKGSLKDRQIGPKCVPRYNFALQRFFALLPYLFVAWGTTWEERDLQVGSYLELLWSEGEPRSQAGDILSALQWHYSVRKVLPGAWRKFATWSRLEPSTQVHPLPIQVLFAIVGVAVNLGDIEFATGIYLAFHCMLRTGELLDLQFSQVREDADSVVLVLAPTKTTKRHGQTEYVTVECPVAKLLLKFLCRKRGATGKLISCSPYFFRKRWAEIMTALQLNDGGFAPYSLRRGGATHDFNVNANFDRSLTRGRWQCVKTCRIYVRQGEEALSRIALTAAQKQCFDLWAAYLREYLQRLQISMG